MNIFNQEQSEVMEKAYSGKWVNNYKSEESPIKIYSENSNIFKKERQKLLQPNLKDEKEFYVNKERRQCLKSLDSKKYCIEKELQDKFIKVLVKTINNLIIGILLYNIDLDMSYRKLTKKERDFKLYRPLKKEQEVDDFEVMPEVEDFIHNRLPYYPSDEELIEMVKDGTIPTIRRK